MRKSNLQHVPTLRAGWTNARPGTNGMPDIIGEHQVATQVEELKLPSVLMNAIAVSTVGRYWAGVRVARLQTILRAPAYIVKWRLWNSAAEWRALPSAHGS
jgi:hypothetical protein